VGLKLNRKHQLLACADDFNLLGGNIETIKRTTEIVIFASKEVGLEINIEKTKCILMPCGQNTDQNWDIKIGNRSFKSV
jgi:hypothetical protein